MSDENSHEQYAKILLAGSAIISIIIGFASGSIATAFGSFLGIIFLFGVVSALFENR